MMQKNQTRRLGICFTVASLIEVCVQPSPGLVSPMDAGAHIDMSLITFMVGTSVLAPYFTLFADLGYSKIDSSPAELFRELRALGSQAERDLLKATAGVNTQRGQLFLLGLASGIAGLCIARGQTIPSKEFYSTVREACAGLCGRELAGIGADEAKTTGELQYLKLGVVGVRGEAEAGFPTVEQVGYPALDLGIRMGLSLNDAGVHALINIMSVLVDTTVLGRLGSEGLITMHETARRILVSGSVFTESGRDMILEAHRQFSVMGLSPGGAADLLALSMALYFIEHGLPESEVILTPSLFDA